MKRSIKSDDVRSTIDDMIAYQYLMEAVWLEWSLIIFHKNLSFI